MPISSALSPAHVRHAAGFTALVALTAALLSGCAPAAPQFTARQLAKSVQEAPEPAGYTLSKPDTTQAARDKYQQFTNLYNAGVVTPKRCADLGALEGVATAADFKQGVNDKVADLARYMSTAKTNPYEFLAVQGRIFSKPEGARKFLATVQQVASGCIGGYTTQAVTRGSMSAPALNVETVATSAIESLPEGVAGITVNELSTDETNDPSYQVSFIQRGNTVLAISAGIKPAGNINYEPANRLVTALAKQLAGLKPAS